MEPIIGFRIACTCCSNKPNDSKCGYVITYIGSYQNKLLVDTFWPDVGWFTVHPNTLKFSWVELGTIELESEGRNTGLLRIPSAAVVPCLLLSSPVKHCEAEEPNGGPNGRWYGRPVVIWWAVCPSCGVCVSPSRLV